MPFPGNRCFCWVGSNTNTRLDVMPEANFASIAFHSFRIRHWASTVQKNCPVLRVVFKGKISSEGRRQSPEYVLRSWAGTKEEQQPRDLEVWDRWKDLESTMLCAERV